MPINPTPPPRNHALDPLAWARQFLPEYFSDPPSPFHHELMTTLANPTCRLVARVAPRGHAKSTCAALAYPLWCVCQRRRRNIVIVTHEAGLARQFVRDIRAELETNPHIRTAYGDLAADVAAEADTPPPAKAAPRRPRRRWSHSHFTTNSAITVQAKSTGAGFRGLRVGPHRPDLIICDDIEKDAQVQSPAGRRKLEHWLRCVDMPALAPRGQLLVLGSLIHYDSLLANLRDRQRFPGWDYAVYRALEAEEDADGTFRPMALWPARWPVERLEEERARIGTLAFEQEYQAHPVDRTRRVFRPEWLQRYAESELVPERLVQVIAVDPALGVEDGDFFALWVGSIDTETGVIYTRQLSVARIGFIEQIERLVAAARQWRPLRIGIESVAYQGVLVQSLEDASRRHHLYLPIVPIPQRAPKHARITASSTFYENGTFRLPAVLPPEVEEQFLHFPAGEHDDAPDVCAMGIELARGLQTTGPEVLIHYGDRNLRRDGW